MNNDNKHKWPEYSLEFKHDAVKLVHEAVKGYRKREHVAISLSTLGRWAGA